MSLYTRIPKFQSFLNILLVFNILDIKNEKLETSLLKGRQQQTADFIFTKISKLSKIFSLAKKATARDSPWSRALTPVPLTQRQSPVATVTPVRLARTATTPTQTSRRSRNIVIFADALSFCDVLSSRRPFL